MKRSVYIAFLSLCAFALRVSPAVAGGSCQNNSDCNDSNDCTTDLCVSSNCQHNPVNPGTPCGDPTDNACTDPDTCTPTGICLRNDAPIGTPCTALNVCIEGETCSGGFCAGTYTINCCTTVADCNDHNLCTTDLCVGNVCQHTNVAAGTPCGSSNDTDCTNPDTCDNNGVCTTQNAPDGVDCGGPDCLAGQCGGNLYRALTLPEGGFLGSEARFGLISIMPPAILLAGRVIESQSVDHASIWNCDTAASNCALSLLPEGGAGTSIANALACDSSGTCLTVGAAGLPSHPAAWWFNGATWMEEVVPLPGGTIAGRCVGELVHDTLSYDIVGFSYNSSALFNATRWERDLSGVWSVALLPDFSNPQRDSLALGIVLCPTGAPAQLCSGGARLITGMAEDGPGVARPIVWRETGANTGVFEMKVLPLPAGSIGLAVDRIGEDSLAVATADIFKANQPFRIIVTGNDALSPAGTVELTDGTRRGVVWRTTDFQSWTLRVLPPLGGHAHSTLEGTAPNLSGVLIGSSFPAGSTSLLDGRGTLWTIDPVALDLVSGPSNMNTVTNGLPAMCNIVYACDWVPNLPFLRVLLSCPGANTAGGTFPPHSGVVFTGPPAGVPAVSTWGLAAMGLFVVIAGTTALRRTQCHAPK